MSIIYNKLPTNVRSQMFQRSNVLPSSTGVTYRKMPTPDQYRKIIGASSFNRVTPYTSLTRGGNNCIHGVCDAVTKELNAAGYDSPLKAMFTGNETFKDKALSLGYMPINGREVTSFMEGDIMQYQALKSTKPDLYPNARPTDYYPYHSSIIGKITNGKALVGNNGGNELMMSTSQSVADLIRRASGKDPMYPAGATIWRYDPEGAKRYKQGKAIDLASIQGINPHAKSYLVAKPNPQTGNTKLPFSWIEAGSAIFNPADKVRDLFSQKNVPEELSTIYRKNYASLGKTSNVPPQILDRMFAAQVGISKQESRFGTSARKDIKDLIPTSVMPALRKITGFFDAGNGTDKGDNAWMEEYYMANVNGVKSQFGTVKQFKQHMLEKYRDPMAEIAQENVTKSRGMFQQKELSPRGRHLNANMGNTEGQFMASMGLMIDNFHIAKRRYPGLSDDKLVDVATLMHNSPKLASIPEYVNYFITKDDSTYVNKIKGNHKQ